MKDNGRMPEALDAAALGIPLGLESSRSVALSSGARASMTEAEVALFGLAWRTRNGDWDHLGAFARTLLPSARRSQAQLFQDLFVVSVLDGRRDGYFVEIGTGDGKIISNTYLLEKEYGWSGIVVEPNPVFHDALRAHRNCLISADCIDEVSGRQVHFRCSRDPEFSSIANYSEAGPHADRFGKDSVTLDIETLSFDDLMEDARAPAHIDYVSIDVEGAELAILKGIDFNRWTIDCLTVEHNWTEQRSGIHILLSDVGYTRVLTHFSQWDDWYVHERLLDAWNSRQ